MATERLILGVMPPFVNSLHVLVFGSTLLVYNTPRIARMLMGQQARRPYAAWYYVLFIVGGILSVLALLHMPGQVVITSCALGLFAFAYFLPLLPRKKRLRDFGWLKISVLAGVWTMATSVLPVLYTGGDITEYPLEILLRLLFIFSLCIIFDIRDMQKDQRDNIHTLPQKVGIVNSYRLIDFMLLLFVVVSVIQYSRFHDDARLVGALLTAVCTRVVAAYLRRAPSDRAYLLLADGVMILYAMLVMVRLP